MTRPGKKPDRLQVGSEVKPVEVEQVQPVRVVKSKKEVAKEVATLFLVTLCATIIGGGLISLLFSAA